MASSRAPATITALVAAVGAVIEHTVDGPMVSSDFTDAVFIGYDGNPRGDMLAVEETQEWAGLGQRRRGQDFAVICAATALSGEKNPSDARGRAYALLAQVEQVLRDNPALGFSPPFRAEIESGDLFIDQLTNGIQARLVFRVHVVTRI